MPELICTRPFVGITSPLTGSVLRTGCRITCERIDTDDPLHNRLCRHNKFHYVDIKGVEWIWVPDPEQPSDVDNNNDDDNNDDDIVTVLPPTPPTVHVPGPGGGPGFDPSPARPPGDSREHLVYVFNPIESTDDRQASPDAVLSYIQGDTGTGYEDSARALVRNFVTATEEEITVAEQFAGFGNDARITKTIITGEIEFNTFGTDPMRTGTDRLRPTFSISIKDYSSQSIPRSDEYFTDVNQSYATVTVLFSDKRADQDDEFLTGRGYRVYEAKYSLEPSGNVISSSVSVEWYGLDGLSLGQPVTYDSATEFGLNLHNILRRDEMHWEARDIEDNIRQKRGLIRAFGEYIAIKLWSRKRIRVSAGNSSG